MLPHDREHPTIPGGNFFHVLSFKMTIRYLLSRRVALLWGIFDLGTVYYKYLLRKAQVITTSIKSCY